MNVSCLEGFAAYRSGLSSPSLATELLRFLALLVANPSAALSPSAPVESAWHRLLLNPVLYYGVCKHVRGDKQDVRAGSKRKAGAIATTQDAEVLIPHDPARAEDTIDIILARYERTLALYEAMFFSEPPEEWWPRDYKKAAAAVSAAIVPVSAQTPRARALEALAALKLDEYIYIDAIIKFLLDFADDGRVCIKALKVLSFSIESKKWKEGASLLAPADVVAAAIVSAMQKHAGSNADVALFGCRALYNFEAIAGGQSIVDALAPAAIVAAMFEHAEGNADVALYGCRALACIVVIDNGKIAAFKGAHTAVVAAMRKHSDNADVALHGCGALERLSLLDASAAVDAHAPAIVVSVMRKHSEINADVAFHACSALENLAIHEAGNIAVVNALAPLVIVSAMRKHAGHNLDVARSGCRALAIISRRDAGIKAAIDALAPALIVYAMRCHTDSNDVAFDGCWALRNMADSEAGIKAAVDAHAPAAIVAAMDALIDMERGYRVAWEGVRALTIFAECESGKRACLSVGNCIVVVRRAMGIDEDTRERGGRLLQMLRS